MRQQHPLYHDHAVAVRYVMNLVRKSQQNSEVNPIPL